MKSLSCLPIGLVLLTLALAAAPQARADNWGNDFCQYPGTLCGSSSPPAICGFGPEFPAPPPQPNPPYDGPLELVASPSFRQGGSFTLYYHSCKISRWQVVISTTSNNPRPSAAVIYDATHLQGPPAQTIPQCHPPGESFVSLRGLGAGEHDPWDWHDRRSRPFQMQAGSQACIYSAATASNYLQGDTATVSWDAPYNQQRFELHLYRVDGTPGATNPVGWNTSGQQSATWQVSASQAPGRYKIRVRTRNSVGDWRERETNEFDIRPRPTVTNVVAAPATIFVGSPLAVSWNATQQSSWQLFRCNSSGGGCGGAVLSSDTGNASAQQAAWTPPLDSTGTIRIKVRVANASSGASAEALSNVVTLEPRPTITVRWEFFDTSVPEASAPLAPRIRVVTSDGGVTLDPVTVSFATESDHPQPGAATQGLDYLHRQGQILVPVGSASGATFPIPNPIAFPDDALDEPDEAFRVRITGVSGPTAQLGTPAAHGITIVDDDVARLSVVDRSVGESGDALVTVTLSNPSSAGVQVHFATASAGSAQPGADYQQVTGTVSFPAHQTAPRTIAIPILADAVFEPDETLFVDLSSPQGAVLEDARAVVTILDDDEAPTLSLADVAIGEGDSGTTPVTLRFRLSNPSAWPVTGAWGDAAGSALRGQDYLAASGAIELAPLAVEQAITVFVVGDLLDEEDTEAFAIAFSGVVGAEPPSGAAEVTITDDDPLPTLSLGPVQVLEGDAATRPALFPLTLSAPSAREVRVSYGTGGGSASAGGDYFPVTGSVLLRPGETNFAIPVAIVGDRRSEDDETVSLTLSAPVHAELALATAHALIEDDDQSPEPIVDDLAVVESVATVAFPILGAFDGPRAVTYRTEDGSAEAGLDYETVFGSITLPQAPGEVRIKVKIFDDAELEGRESFALVLRDAVSGAEVARGVATIHEPAVGGDFDADGHADLLWRDRAEGAIEAWLMAERTRRGVGATDPPMLNPLWKLVGTADFDSDGLTDILWRHETSSRLVVWFMDGLSTITGQFTDPDGSTTAGWSLAGTGDFDGDAQPDLLWHNATSGKLVVWRMNGIVRIAGEFTTPDGVADTRWRVAGVADFDGDGRPDILWRNTLSGRTVLWLMDGLVGSGGGFTVPYEGDPSWQVAVLADYTRDGRADIVWRHAETGALRVWSMDGTLRLQELPFWPAGRTEPEWELVGPR